MATAPTLSKSRIDRAGRRLKEWWAEGNHQQMQDDEQLRQAAWDAFDFREGFQDPLKKVTVGVRQFVRRESSEIIVAQRLKRMPQMINKLVRFPSMRLTQMEDIGGCRAILPGGAAEVAGVLRRIERNWDIVDTLDYVSAPKLPAIGRSM